MTDLANDAGNMTVAPTNPATWYAQTAVGHRQWPSLTFDLDTDVCVVGGGLAGITVAREVAKRGWSVALIEAGRIAEQASGRNTGFVLPGYGQDARRLVERCGLQHAKALWALSEEGVAYVRNAILGLAMPGVAPIDGWLDVSMDDNPDAVMRALDLLGQHLGVDVEGWPTERVREVLRSDCYFHSLHFPKAFHIHPLNYAFSLAADAERRGARLFEQTTALEMDPLGLRKRVTTRSAKIRANHIVLAGNAHLGRIAPDLSATILPMTTHVAVTQPVADLADAVAFAGAVSGFGRADHQYRIIDQNRLMWSSGATTWGGGSARRHGDRITAAIMRIFPQLGGVDVANVWSGTSGLAVHGMPQIGEISPGLWIASAFGNHGINTTAIAGEVLARAIVDHDDTWKLFLPYDLVWAGGALGRTVLQGNLWTRRASERVRAGLARKRAAAVRAGDPIPAAADTRPEA
jgi:gamma-glutamylputrescine oxidase